MRISMRIRLLYISFRRSYWNYSDALRLRLWMTTTRLRDGTRARWNSWRFTRKAQATDSIYSSEGGIWSSCHSPGRWNSTNKQSDVCIDRANGKTCGCTSLWRKRQLMNECGRRYMIKEPSAKSQWTNYDER